MMLVAIAVAVVVELAVVLLKITTRTFVWIGGSVVVVDGT
jgi:hypothetical protein